MKILYICTHNRCRSILFEAITNHLAKGHIVAQSAGSHPAGVVHPLALHYLRENDIAVEGLQSQSWDAFENFKPDLVITVCDAAAGETCPIWFGNAIKMHWGLSDPSQIEGSDEAKALGFRACIAEIKKRVAKLLAVAEQDLSPAELKAELAKCGAQ